MSLAVTRAAVRAGVSRAFANASRVDPCSVCGASQENHRRSHHWADRRRRKDLPPVRLTRSKRILGVGLAGRLGVLAVADLRSRTSCATGRRHRRRRIRHDDGRHVADPHRARRVQHPGRPQPEHPAHRPRRRELQRGHLPLARWRGRGRPAVRLVGRPQRAARQRGWAPTRTPPPPTAARSRAASTSPARRRVPTRPTTVPSARPSTTASRSTR